MIQFFDVLELRKNREPAIGDAALRQVQIGELIGRFGKAGQLDKLLVGALLGGVELNSAITSCAVFFGFSGGFGGSACGRRARLGRLATGGGAGGFLLFAVDQFAESRRLVAAGRADESRQRRRMPSMALTQTASTVGRTSVSAANRCS